MAIQGVNGGFGSYGPGGIGPRPARPESTGLQRLPANVPATKQTPTGIVADNGAIPAEAPPGTDPELWSVLSAEERQFFSRLQSSGPLTYGPGSANIPPGLVRGARIDRTV